MNIDQWFSNLAAGNTPHAVLLTGPVGVGKKTFARQAAALYLKGTRDIDALQDCPFFQEFEYDKVREEIAGDKTKTIVGELRKICRGWNQQAFGRGRRCLYFPDAHRMNDECQNALLKTLEEPPIDAMLILAGNEEGLLPTIRSRCMKIQVGTKTKEEIHSLLLQQGFDPAAAAFGATLSDGIIGLGMKYAGEEFRTFYQDALKVAEDALFGLTPFAKMSELIKPSKKTVVVEETAEEEGEGKKKKAKSDSGKAEDFCNVLLRVLRGSLPEFSGTLPEKNGRDLAIKVSRRFTREQIQGMIYQVLLSQKQLFQKNGTGQVLDLLLLELKNIQNR